MVDGDDRPVITEPELTARVDAAFDVTGQDLARWPDPHPDRSPADEEYSRLSDPAKWRIVGARADAWLMALAETGLAVIHREPTVRWRVPPPTVVSRAVRAVPLAEGALPLVVARSRLGSLDDAGVTLAAGDPAVCVVWIPDCGCDACDSGSQDVLDELDRYVFSVVSGTFRRLWSGDREITVVSSDARRAHWGVSGKLSRTEVDSVLVDPTGWHEVSGASWMPAG
jgi:hypothetical protein